MTITTTTPPLRYRRVRGAGSTLLMLETADGGLETTWTTDPGAAASLAGRVEDEAWMPSVAARLEAYFAGGDPDFSDVPVPDGGPFFARCWQACRAIPRGRTMTYRELAERAGSTASAARAAGQAMRRNRLPVIVPCHRVIGTDGDLHGFAGSTDADGPSLGLKRRLLELEEAVVAV